MTKKKRKALEEAPASHEVPGSDSSAYSKPPPRPYPKRHRVTVTFPEKGLTRGSFRDECDIKKIVGKFVDTGILTHQQRGKPEYGDAPDQNLFEAACTQAALRSAGEDGVIEEYLNAQETPSEPPEATEPANPAPTPAEPETAAQLDQSAE